MRAQRLAWVLAAGGALSLLTAALSWAWYAWAMGEAGFALRDVLPCLATDDGICSLQVCGSHLLWQYASPALLFNAGLGLFAVSFSLPLVRRG